MTRQTSLFLAIACLSGSAFATNYGNFDPDSSSSRADSSSSSRSNANSSSRSKAVGVGIGLGVGISTSKGGSARNNTTVNTGDVANAASATGGVASAQGGSSTSQGGTASASNGNQSTSVTFTSPASTTSTVYQAGKTRAYIQNTPDVSLFTAQPTAPCIVTGGAAGSGPGLSLAINGGLKDDTCSVLEIRRLAGDNPAILQKTDSILMAELNKIAAKSQPVKRDTSGGFGY